MQCEMQKHSFTNNDGCNLLTISRPFSWPIWSLIRTAALCTLQTRLSVLLRNYSVLFAWNGETMRYVGLKRPSNALSGNIPAAGRQFLLRILQHWFGYRHWKLCLNCYRIYQRMCLCVTVYQIQEKQNTARVVDRMYFAEIEASFWKDLLYWSSNIMPMTALLATFEPSHCLDGLHSTDKWRLVLHSKCRSGGIDEHQRLKVLRTFHQATEQALQSVSVQICDRSTTRIENWLLSTDEFIVFSHHISYLSIMFRHNTQLIHLLQCVMISTATWKSEYRAQFPKDLISDALQHMR